MSCTPPKSLIQLRYLTLSWSKSEHSDHTNVTLARCRLNGVGFPFCRCTALHGVPTHFLGVLSELERRRNDGDAIDLSQLRTGIAAGSPIPIDLMKQLIDKMNLTELTVAYGMS